MTQPHFVGICRFSFLGLGDWQDFRDDRSLDDDRLSARAEMLYADARMETRFRAFEAICLPSVLAQDDPRFLFLIVSSTRMPTHWQDRLRRLCEPYTQIHLHWSEATDLGDALTMPLAEMQALSDGDLWQFRLDDDDAIADDYLVRLRMNAPRLDGLAEAAISFARGLNVAIYAGQPIAFLEYAVPFQSAGLAVRSRVPGRSIYAFGHFNIRLRFPHFVDHGAPAALMLKWASDSHPVQLARLPAGTQAIRPAIFQRHLRDRFPHLVGYDFESLRPGDT